MVAGLLAMLVSWGWRRSEALSLALPAQKAAALAGFLAAFAYCLISGFAVPAQRTLYMVGVVAVALWFGRATSASRVLAAALFIVLALDPWAVLSPGFWLSFAAVAVIFFVATGRTAKAHWLAQWGRVQWAVTAALQKIQPLKMVVEQTITHVHLREHLEVRHFGEVLPGLLGTDALRCIAELLGIQRPAVALGAAAPILICLHRHADKITSTLHRPTGCELFKQKPLLVRSGPFNLGRHAHYPMVVSVGV